MISPRKNQGMIVLVLVLIGSVAWASEPNEVPIKLEFEISPTPLGPYSASSMGPEWEPFFSYRPAYAVAIPRLEPALFLPRPGEEMMDVLLLRVAEREAGLSARQQAFLKAVAGVYTSGIAIRTLMDRPDPNGPERVILYAMTLDDAKKMAQAYLQSAMNAFRRSIARAEDQIHIASENMQSAEKRIAELAKESETARQSLEELQKTVPYRMESEAHEALAELNRMVSAAEVEIAGIRAKMDRIEGYRQEPRAGLKLPPDAAAKLGMMLVEEDIALQGAAARSQMATRLREQARRFVDLTSTLAKAPGEKETLTRKLAEARRDLSLRQGSLRSLKKEREPQIPAKVVIYPVKWVDEVSQN